MQQLRDALEVAFGYDTSILAEPAQDGSIEINCSVLGWGDDLQVSVCEQPVSSGTLSYADKYLSGAKAKGGAKAPAAGMKSSQRIIPAPISDVADQTHPGNGDGVVSRHRRRRRDASRLPGRRRSGTRSSSTSSTPCPGSLSFYLWEASGMGFDALLTRLIEMAMARHREQQATTSSIDTWLLTGRPG